MWRLKNDYFQARFFLILTEIDKVSCPFFTLTNATQAHNYSAAAKEKNKQTEKYACHLTLSESIKSCLK